MRSPRILLVITTAIAMPVVWAHAACPLSSAAVSGNTATVGRIVLDLGEADDSRHPTAWQGPLKIAAAGGPPCTVSEEVAIIEKPLLLAGTTVYVPTYSGSENRLYSIDTRTCEVIWKSQPYAGPIRYTDGQIVVGAKTVRLNRACRPETSPPRSAGSATR
jgi:outer membrane protein assembly factor BamB